MKKFLFLAHKQSFFLFFLFFDDKIVGVSAFAVNSTECCDEDVNLSNVLVNVVVPCVSVAVVLVACLVAMLIYTKCKR